MDLNISIQPYAARKAIAAITQDSAITVVCGEGIAKATNFRSSNLDMAFGADQQQGRLANPAATWVDISL